ncbi:MAG: biotin--[acetyl-CoA-carboxylase] ligase [Planctomycetes bacterium]|nr:biotin--[acetyl-CoA-carboxylase] ligase [Planctomycetota bacterium]
MSSRSRSTLTPEQLRHGWTARRIGRHVITLAETPSTNSLALESIPALGGADGQGADGLVVIADYQTAGRGRLGRYWLSPRAASILCSVVIVPTHQELSAGSSDPAACGRPEPPRGENTVAPTPTTQFSGRLTLISAIAACEAIRQSTEVTPAIKWPNDLRVSGRKLGGILIESRSVGHGRRAWVIGIGINCLQHAGHFPPELRGFATSLEIEASHPIDRLELARSLLQHLDRRLADSPSQAGNRESPEAIRSAWERYAEPIGQRVRLRTRGREYAGTTVAVDPFGGLIVQTDDGKREWFDPLQTTLL